MARGPAPHVCCYCGKTHKRGAKTFDVEHTRCVKREGCITNPVRLAKPPSVHVCFICSASVPQRERRCRDRDACRKRSLSRLKVIRHDDATIRRWYEQAPKLGFRVCVQPVLYDLPDPVLAKGASR